MTTVINFNQIILSLLRHHVVLSTFLWISIDVGAAWKAQPMEQTLPKMFMDVLLLI